MSSISFQLGVTLTKAAEDNEITNMALAAATGAGVGDVARRQVVKRKGISTGTKATEAAKRQAGKDVSTVVSDNKKLNKDLARLNKTKLKDIKTLTPASTPSVPLSKRQAMPPVTPQQIAAAKMTPAQVFNTQRAALKKQIGAGTLREVGARKNLRRASNPATKKRNIQQATAQAKKTTRGYKGKGAGAAALAYWLYTQLGR